ncbi:uncharacterized protein LOC126686025 [Mercurialis annua]|uniref:uncharacterized protein LOC126686025 n=1 Tax=Mercurialis annua TaxID=3986 RepID=UPI0021604A64|nr:uncharacterized protein LOC126686025 [Mercurialis annua]
MADQEKWVNNYSSIHRILLVGEGDFSFSSSLAQSLGSASNIVATSLDSYDAVVKKYKKAKSNLENLSKLGASIFHGVDTTKMKLHSDLKMQKFDRIIFNFPHAGFHGKEDNVRLIEMHKKLVLGFFRNASGILRAFGEVHVTHKTSAPFCHWNIEELGQRNCLVVVECVKFKIEDYPGYNNKRGDGTRCDEPFPLGECSIFKFRFSAALNKMSNLTSHSGFALGRSELYQDIPIQTHCNQLTSFHFGHPQEIRCRDMNDVIRHRLSPLVFNARSTNEHINHASEVHQRPIISDTNYFANRAQGCDYERYMAEARGGFQHFQCSSSSIRWPQQAPFSHLSRQTELDRNMNGFSGYMGETVRINVGNENSNALHRKVEFFADQLQGCDYTKASERSRYFKDNVFRMHHNQALSSPMNYQKGFNTIMNEHPGYRTKNLNAPSRDVDYFPVRASGCERERFMAEVAGRTPYNERVYTSQGFLNPPVGDTWSQSRFVYSQHVN